MLAGVSKSFRGRPVLHELSLSVEPGAFHGLLGLSGAGKSTLLRIVAGLEEPEAGQVIISGRTVWTQTSSVPAAARGVGMVFQDLALWPHMDVRQHLDFVLAGLEPTQRKKRIAECLQLVGLTDRGHARPHELSGGERQRLAMARALAPGPALLLLDEPLKSLDEPLAARLALELRESSRRAAATVLFVTHARRQALGLCDAVSILSGGRIVASDHPSALLAPDAPQAARALLSDLVCGGGDRR